MKYHTIANTDLHVSNLIMGNMRLTELSLQEAEKLIRTAMEEEINFFDHADIYGPDYVGQCEEYFANAIQMNSSLREKMVIQSNGKVRHFGVSNHNPAQIQLLEKYIGQKLVVNQVQFSIAHTPIIDSGISLNMGIDQAVNRDSSVLEYCRLNDITLQAWSPFQNGFFEGPFLGDKEKFGKLNEVIDRIASKYSVTNTAIAVAWITTHPANIQVVLGTTNIQRMKDASKGSEIKLTREEWYDIYKAAGNMVP